MLIKALRLTIFLCLLGSWGISHAQNITKSPYSIIGVGDIVYGGNALTYSLGQCNQAIRTPYNVNMMNPASYSSFAYYTNIEAGATMSFGRFKGAANSSDVNNAWIGYFNFGLPISSKHGIGMSFGATPFSGVGYNIVSKVTLPQDTFSIDALNYFVGRGGLTRAYMGFGMKVNKRVSLGVNGNYIWGQSTNTTQLLIPSKYLMFNTNEDKTTYVHGWSLDAGIQIHDTFNIYKNNEKRQYEWIVGGTITPESQYSAEQTYLLRTLPVGSTSGIKDTIYSEVAAKGYINAPLSWKGGVSFARKDVWLVTADVKGTQWSNYQKFGNKDSLRNSFGVSMGGSYTPNYRSKNFLARTDYRIGARYEKSNLSVRGTGVDVLSFSAGVGLPIYKSRSRLNLGMEVQRRGTTENGLVQENYFRVYLGISFADSWFHRYRYD